uniref:Linear conopeptide n=2 Tax=Conus consors TaxID=101297 RepID=CXL_CONCN|nr:RecName: Full=Linear conopeptide; Contains: RecName: Full=Linear conopeptide-Cn1; Contains: RecName: Full=Linear conopeptide-Cn2; AltName: Full=[oxMet6]-Cn2; Contains: RecName: Full=Linear conopeptide-Cn3; Contains: RecName: Full=Linear conopeptide-Cn4; Flags: Precursor [Conus consors]CCI55487.1 linear conopeptide Cn1 precursor [Conus consors]
MLRLIIAAAVLVSACLAYPQRREGAPADAANLQSFDPALMSMQGMQGGQMPGMAGGQFLPFNPNLQMGYKRDFDENLEKRKQHSQFNADENKAPFDSEENFMNFLHNEKGDKHPFANVDSADTDLGQFEPSAENKNGEFRFFDKEQ